MTKTFSYEQLKKYRELIMKAEDEVSATAKTINGDYLGNKLILNIVKWGISSLPIDGLDKTISKLKAEIPNIKKTIVKHEKEIAEMRVKY